MPTSSPRSFSTTRRGWYRGRRHDAARIRSRRVLTAGIVVIHVSVSLLLVLLILLHSGRGGGLSDMFGGGMGSAAAGSTVVERNLDRITVATALVFTFTTIILAIRLQA